MRVCWLRSLNPTCAIVVGAVLLAIVPCIAAGPASTRPVAPAYTAVQAAPATLPPVVRPSDAGEGVEEPSLDDRLAFLRAARVVKEKSTKKGVTAPRRLTLRHGIVEHDAVFQAVDEKKWDASFADGRREMQFRDYWGFNVAAFQLVRMLGYPELIPATVERRHGGRQGALVWWVNAMADEQERRAKNLTAPDGPAWSRQVMVARLFEVLFADTDRNLTNSLITPDWRLVMIDFTRAFRTHKELKKGFDKLLLQCDRELLDRLRTLTAAEVKAAAGTWLDTWQIEALLHRRDAIVAHFDRLVAERGEGLVLF